MKRYFSIFTLLLLSSFISAQDLHLQMLLDSAETYYPKYQEYELNQRLSKSKLDQLKKTNLPQLALKGKATWQSEVMELPIELPGVDIPSLSQDQYQASLELVQPIYKGGLTKAKQEMEKVDQQIRDAETTTSLYQIRQRIASIYFQVLLNQKQLEVIALHKETISAKKKELQSLVKEGMLLQQTIDYLKAELISIQQQEFELNSKESTLRQELKRLSGIDISNDHVFILPTQTSSNDAAIKRQELDLMKLQIEKMDVAQSMVKVQNRPFVSAYATAGYGRPGLNYFSNEFSDFYMIGLQFQWKLWDWQDGKQQISQLQIQQDLVKVKEEEFIQEININAQKMLDQMILLDGMKAQDEELIQLRSNIAEISSQQLKNGTLTSSAYMEELNKLKQARLNAELHQVQYALAQVNYLWIKGLL